MSIAPRARRAFSLLELVVVTAILVVTTGVIIPKILQVRARMGDVTCQNNLRRGVMPDLTQPH